MGRDSKVVEGKTIFCSIIKQILLCGTDCCLHIVAKRDIVEVKFDILSGVCGLSK